MLIDILKSIWRRLFNLIVIVSPTFSLQDISNEIVDGSGIVIIPEWRTCIIEELTELQKDKIHEKQESSSAAGRPKAIEDFHVLLIFDDIGLLGKEGNLSKQMGNLAFVVRHYKISIVEL